MFGLRASKKTRTNPATDASGEILEHLGSDGGHSARHHPRSPREAIQPESVPQPPGELYGKKSPVLLLLNGLMSLIIFAFVLTGGAYVIFKQQFDAPGPLRQTRAVIVPAGANVTQIARRLEQEGVISDATLFLAGVHVAKVSNDLKAGEYLFQEQVNMREVMDLLVDGRSILHKITIPEGLTSAQIVARLMEAEILTGEIDAIPGEGTLLPETYKFTRGTDRNALVERMRKAHERAVARIWNRRDKDLPLESPEELVILASIVEKETGRADERPRVAAVFVNRLKRKMRLQSDPTIIYGVAGGEGALGRPILRSEIDKATPYNTYKIDGLPPTPIANPGIEALEATANPSHTQDIYFVADGNGGHVFAASLDEHNRNVARWRKIQSEPNRNARPAGEATENTVSATPVPPPTPTINLNLAPLSGR